MIKLLVTGGTIDKHYNALAGKLDFNISHIPQMLIQSRCQVDIAVEELFLKDSLEMEDKERECVYQACLATQEERIIITHGTDTIAETAQFLGQYQLKKTIILLGAMVPYVFKNSDALFNLGSAVSAVQCLPHGVYITMNGKVFHWDNVVKNTEKGVFELID